MQQRSEIDTYLGLYASALAHQLQDAEWPFDKILSYIQQHKLYIPALTLLLRAEENDEKYMLVLKSYAAYLEGQHDYREAAFAYQGAGLWSEAVDMFLSQEPLDWQSAFTAARLAQDPALLADVVPRIISELKVMKQYGDAARIQQHYVLLRQQHGASEPPRDGIAEAFRLYLEAEAWQEALQLCRLHAMDEEDLLDRVRDSADRFHESIHVMHDKWTKQVKRLLLVKEEKLARLGIRFLRCSTEILY